ncbi:hypothetical protein ACQKKX_02440 [Neorhizobium sp. NPDC001467]|uniref:hypothetical protein n=1 Tax=Neorhizobium sp. NPDC001467 TaxID=3390595 RepID=UPI003D085B4E
MPYTGDIYNPPAGTKGAPKTTIQSAKYNAMVDDITAAQNYPRPLTGGGTGATNALQARANLGLAIGSDVQAYDAGLTSLANLPIVAGLIPYTVGADLWATTGLTEFARFGLGASSAAAFRGHIELGSLSTLNVVNDVNWSGADLSIANGGTGASSAAAARANLDTYSKAETDAVANGRLSLSGGTVAGPVILSGTAGQPVPILQMTYQGIRSWKLQVDPSGTLAIIDLTSGLQLSSFDTQGNFTIYNNVKAGGIVYAGNGASALTAVGNVFGSIWSAWGASDAFTAIDSRISAFYTTGIAQIMPTVAAQGVGAIGTYAMLAFTDGTTTGTPGQNFSGPNLRYANNNGSGAAVNTGTWKLMGDMSTANRASLFLRIS